jgi:hypothetical protein
VVEIIDILIFMYDFSFWECTTWNVTGYQMFQQTLLFPSSMLIFISWCWGGVVLTVGSELVKL